MTFVENPLGKIGPAKLMQQIRRAEATLFSDMPYEELFPSEELHDPRDPLHLNKPNQHATDGLGSE